MLQHYSGAVAIAGLQTVHNPVSLINCRIATAKTTAIMATKSAAVGSKRKVAPSGKGKFDGNAKKARLDEKKVRREPIEDPEEDSDDVSDSEEGGASLGDNAPKKSWKEANGKTFERGMCYFRVVSQHNC